MGIKIEDFLYEYFDVTQLKDALSDIGVPAGKTKEESVNKILEKWTTRNRSWYDLLNFLDTEDLENICEHFQIEYTDWDDEESLMDKIEEEWVLDFKSKQKKNVEKKKVQKNIIEKPSINIGEQNINIGSHNKINSDNTAKINSDNTIYSNLSKYQKLLLIVGIVTIFVIIGIAVYQMNEPTIENQNGDVPNESPEIIAIESNVNEKNLPEHQRIIQTYDSEKPFSIIFKGCNLHTVSHPNDMKLEYEISLDPQIIDKDGDIATIPFNSSYRITPKANIEGISYLVNLDTIQVSKYTINPSGEGRLTFDITKTLSDAKDMNALGVNLFFDKISITPYSDITDSNILPYQKVLEDVQFFELVYPPVLGKWTEPADKHEICLGKIKFSNNIN